MLSSSLDHHAAIAAAAAGHGHQGFRIGAPRRVEGLERGAEAGEQAERVVVGIDRDPGDGGPAGEPGDQAGEGGGLAEPGRRREQHQALGEGRVDQALLQRLASNQAGAGTRCLDLGQGERRRGHGGVGS